MEAVYFLAELYGFSMIVIGLALTLRPHNGTLLVRMLEHEESILLQGMIKLVLGIAALLAYHTFDKNWTLIVSVLSSLLVIGGLLRLFYPELILKVIAALKKNSNLLTFIATALVLVGCILLYFSI